MAAVGQAEGAAAALGERVATAAGAAKVDR